MKQNVGLVKRLALWVGAVSFLSLSVSASAAVLTLTDWTTLPVPPGATHADTYLLPTDISLSTTNPITQVEIDYQNVPFVPGGLNHEIKSAAFLFNSGDLASTTVFESTTQRFWARIVFKTTPVDRRMTGLTNRFEPAFAAYHGSQNTLTSALWTVTYANGATQTSNNGIIPEPCTLASLAVSASLAMLIRRRNRASCPA